MRWRHSRLRLSVSSRFPDQKGRGLNANKWIEGEPSLKLQIGKP